MKDRMSGLALISMVLCWASPLAAQSLADTGEGYIIHAHDFDLEAVVALIEEDRVSDAAHLVEVINAPSSGINNVDVDWDGLVDTIDIREMRGDNEIIFEVVALPSSAPFSHEVLVATVSLNDATQTVQLIATYPESVDNSSGYLYASETPHPVFTDDFEERGFASWSFMPYRAPFVMIRDSFNTSHNHFEARPVETKKTVVTKRGYFRLHTRLPNLPTTSEETFFTPQRRLAYRQVRVNKSRPKLRRTPVSLALAHPARAESLVRRPVTGRGQSPRIIYIRPAALAPPSPAAKTGPTMAEPIIESAKTEHGTIQHRPTARRDLRARPRSLRRKFATPIATRHVRPSRPIAARGAASGFRARRSARGHHFLSYESKRKRAGLPPSTKRPSSKRGRSSTPSRKVVKKRSSQGRSSAIGSKGRAQPRRTPSRLSKRTTTGPQKFRRRGR